MPKTTKMTEKKTGTGSQTSRITKSQAEKYLSKVPEQNVFWCNNGTVLRDIRELRDALANMPDQTYAYHSNEIKKDFSDWMRDIVGDKKLADDLVTARSREDALKMVEARCSLLQSRVE